MKKQYYYILAITFGTSECLETSIVNQTQNTKISGHFVING